MPLRAVVFDLFGTLAPFSPKRHRQVLAEAARILTAPPFEFAQLWDTVRAEREATMAGTLEDSLHYVLRTLGIYTHLDQVQRAVDLLHESERLPDPAPEAVSALSALRQRGLKTGLISNAVAATARRWPDSPLAPLIDAAVFSCVAGVRKPDPRIYEMACVALGVSARECLYVGDGSSRELSGAEAAGMGAVMLRRSDEDPEDARLMDREAWEGKVLSGLRDLPTLLQAEAGAKS